MKIAIVHGGFDGLALQMKRWRLERECEEQKCKIANCEQNLRASRTRLATLEAERDATPTQEIKT